MNYPENKKIQIVVINKKSEHNEHFEIIISVKPNKTVDEIIELIDLLIDQTEYGKVQVATLRAALDKYALHDIMAADPGNTEGSG